jgi:hypothetical protein
MAETALNLRRLNQIVRYGMNEITDQQWRELAKLGKNIIICLRQNLNGDGVPPRSDRFEALKLMQRYLAIHDIETD